MIHRATLFSRHVLLRSHCDGALSANPVLNSPAQHVTAAAVFTAHTSLHSRRQLVTPSRAFHQRHGGGDRRSSSSTPSSSYVQHQPRGGGGRRDHAATAPTPPPSGTSPPFTADHIKDRTPIGGADRLATATSTTEDGDVRQEQRPQLGASAPLVLRTPPALHALAVFVDTAAMTPDVFVRCVLPLIARGCGPLPPLASTAAAEGDATAGEKATAAGVSTALRCATPPAFINSTGGCVCLLRCFGHGPPPAAWQAVLTSMSRHLQGAQAQFEHRGSRGRGTMGLTAPLPANHPLLAAQPAADGVPSSIASDSHTSIDPAPSLSPPPLLMPLFATAAQLEYMQVDDFMPLTIQLCADMDHVQTLAASNAITGIVAAVAVAERAGYILEAMQRPHHLVSRYVISPSSLEGTGFGPLLEGL